MVAHRGVGLPLAQAHVDYSARRIAAGFVRAAIEAGTAASRFPATSSAANLLRLLRGPRLPGCAGTAGEPALPPVTARGGTARSAGSAPAWLSRVGSRGGPHDLVNRRG